MSLPRLALLVSFLALSCGPAPAAAPPGRPEAATPAPLTLATATPSPGPLTGPYQGPLHVALVWHQHQPLYFRDPLTGVYQRPWVRAHAAKDYLDMAQLVARYPDLRVTFNLTPTLIRQLDDLSAGARDLYWTLTEVPAGELSAEEKAFLLERFFDTNRRVIARFPRYAELLEKRGAPQSWTAEDFRDLQVLWNLAWTDPDYLAQEPLAGLMAKGRGYSEADKAVVLGRHLELVGEVIPFHARLQESGQIEITMTPFAHPILPLLVSTDLARRAMPEAPLPRTFSFPQDARAQVRLGVELYQERFRRAPRGMWPAEGAVAQEIVGLVGEAGMEWMASDEGVLARSLGLGTFDRDGSETVIQADLLYRPWLVQEGEHRVAILFRDQVISDRIGFAYSSLPGRQAARDLLSRLENVRQALRDEPGPHLVTILLDGENAWEHYENDGKEFLNALYEGLSADGAFQTVTPGEFLQQFPGVARPIEDLWAGSWIGADFSTWIGEQEENVAWQYLLAAREAYAAAGAPGEEAARLLYAAQGSDWFWWYGSDQDSGDDESFDLMFRSTLLQLYQELGMAPPAVLQAPIVPRPEAVPTRPLAGPSTATIDGRPAEEEWSQAAYYQAPGPGMAALYLTHDSKNVYLRLDALGAWPGEVVEVYLSAPTATSTTPISDEGMPLGFHASHRFRFRLEALRAVLGAVSPEGVFPIQAQVVAGEVALQKQTLEMAIPFSGLGDLQAGDRLKLAVLVGDSLSPSAGPLSLLAPELEETTTVLAVGDPQGDDHGPGSYVYPTDPVFEPGVFDLKGFEVSVGEEVINFRFAIYGPLSNPWGSPNGLALQTFDIYIDTDGQPGSGLTELLEARNASLAPGFGWEYALTVEGWSPQLFAAESGRPRKVVAPVRVVVNPAQGVVTARLSREVLPGDPAGWRYAVALLSQDGFAQGRVRAVQERAEQWRIGGGSPTSPRILDLLWPEGSQPTQEEQLLRGLHPHP